MKIGVLGTGGIVKSVTPTLKQIENMECYAIASRTMEKAKEAAEKYGYSKAYGSYEELVQDPQVELVYIATPHSRHYEDMKLCIKHKKPVLCEKAFTMNAAQAKEIKELANKEGVYVAEAIWTRYMPSRKLIQEVLDSGIIGNVSILTANLSYTISQNYRIVAPELAGGALLDVGVYGLNFAIMHFGKEIERIESSVQFTDTGVDGMESITLFYKDGKMAVLTHGIYGRSDRKGIFYGDKGYIVVENINNPQSISVFDQEDKLIKRIDVPAQISGYEYQFTECMDRITKNETESSSMPLDDSIYVMEVADSIRKQWGLTYPQEKE
ncbi:MAG: Gfo/Idh/MocA family oxidoreductase [Lachnospiraceae bacterium]|nr:Gfo/Idh/MocA family oxidoreductase [Lachnospiraceae bacterium]